MFEEKVFELSPPLEHSKQEVHELVFNREMTAGDMKGINFEKISMDDFINITSRMTGYPPNFISKVPMRVMKDVVTYLGEAFLGDGQETGQE